jgi:hypothetical protein
MITVKVKYPGLDVIEVMGNRTLWKALRTSYRCLKEIKKLEE